MDLSKSFSSIFHWTDQQQEEQRRMSHFISLFLMLILAVLVTAQFLDNFDEELQKYNAQAEKVNKVICNSPPKYGKCKGRRQMWFFNSHKLRCDKFVYSNCGGNRNRFFSKAECNTFCTEKLQTWHKTTSILHKLNL